VRVSESAVESALAKTQRMQDELVKFSAGGVFEGGDDAYRVLRSELLSLADIQESLPTFIRRHRDLAAYWQFIKHKHSTYAERRQFLWDSFRPLLDRLESEQPHPAAGPIEAVLKSLDEDSVHAVWKKAMDRRMSDPEGAITAARTLLESVCKHVLDELAVPYPDDADPAKLWALCAEQLNLSPTQHAEPVFRSILGNCQSIVNNLAAIRNKISDAHGKGKRTVRPKARHAELAVNLAGSMAAFLVSTWKEHERAANSVSAGS
jgi:Abortive infection C-terminus